MGISEDYDCRIYNVAMPIHWNDVTAANPVTVNCLAENMRSLTASSVVAQTQAAIDRRRVSRGVNIERRAGAIPEFGVSAAKTRIETPSVILGYLAVLSCDYPTWLWKNFNEVRLFGGNGFFVRCPKWIVIRQAP